MPNIIISREGDEFFAHRNGREIAHGSTQNLAGRRTQIQYPDDPILAQRQRDNDFGDRDHLCRMHPKKIR